MIFHGPPIRGTVAAQHEKFQRRICGMERFVTTNHALHSNRLKYSVPIVLCAPDLSGHGAGPPVLLIHLTKNGLRCFLFHITENFRAVQAVVTATEVENVLRLSQWVRHLNRMQSQRGRRSPSHTLQQYL